MTNRYSLNKIRTLLTESFTDKELRRLCHDEPDFRPVYHELTDDDSKAEIIDRLIEYADQKLKLEELLLAVQKRNPARYTTYQPYTDDGLAPDLASSSSVPTQPPPTAAVSSPTINVKSVQATEKLTWPRPLRVFLCHASGDKPAVRTLYQRLHADGLELWLDEEDLLPGQDWQVEIPKAVRNADVVLVCLSRESITKAGYVQKEIKFALDVADEQPEGTIYLIPLRLEPCEVPERLRRWHWVNLFEERGYERLMRALRARAGVIEQVKTEGKPKVELELKSQPQPPPPVSSPSTDYRLPSTDFPFEPEMILIPAGEFLMGSDPQKDKYARDDEQPQHSLYLPDYYMSKTPVTNAHYATFVKATGYQPPYVEAGWTKPYNWHGQTPPTGQENHPVVLVSWEDAVAYCRWLAEVTGKPYHLPSEAEWEKGARGTDGRLYPWGNKWNHKRCNSSEGGPDGTTPVDAYPDGASPYGLLDMAGNVWEWTRSLYRDYPYDPADGWEDLETGEGRVLRGGSWYDDQFNTRCVSRSSINPYDRFSSVGFRLVVSPIL